MYSLYRSDGSVTVHQPKEYSFHSRTIKNIELIIYLQGFTGYPDGNYLDESTKASRGVSYRQRELHGI
jgi:hypothetical protein